MTNSTMHKSDGVSIVKYIDERFKAISAEIETTTKVRDLQFENVAKQFENITDAIRELRDFMSKQQGKASWTSLIFTAAMAISGLVVAAIALFSKH